MLRPVYALGFFAESLRAGCIAPSGRNAMMTDDVKFMF